MSSEEIQDNQDKTIQDYIRMLLQYIPPGILIKMMNSYLFIREVGERVWNQTRFSMKALKSSFQHQYIQFYKIGNSYIPLYIFFDDTPRLLSGELEWEYTAGDHTFIQIDIETRELRKLPYIAALLTNRDGTEVFADLSEWVSSVSTYSTDAFVPIQVLLTAFVYETNTKIPNSVENLFLRCVNLSLDEVIYSVETGLELDITTDLVASSDVEI